MLVIDPYKTWQTLAERLKTEKNPLHRRQLEKIIYHMKGEAAGDIDQILTTVSPKASYISYDNRDGPPARLQRATTESASSTIRCSTRFRSTWSSSSNAWWSTTTASSPRAQPRAR